MSNTTATTWKTAPMSPALSRDVTEDEREAV